MLGLPPLSTVFLNMQKKTKHWYKPKGYCHVTKIPEYPFISSFVKNPIAIGKHAFYPLIHRVDVQRKYKKVVINGQEVRKHSYKDENGIVKRTRKIRHLYYASHLDAHIYAFYSQRVLTPLYEEKLKEFPGLSECICAYRQIPLEKK